MPFNAGDPLTPGLRHAQWVGEFWGLQSNSAQIPPMGDSWNQMWVCNVQFNHLNYEAIAMWTFYKHNIQII